MLIELKPEEMRGRKPNVKLPEGTFYAGGCIRRWFTGEKQDSDFDIFKLQDNIEIPENWTKVFSNKVQTTYKVGTQIVQVIEIVYEDIQDAFNKFDFHHCQFAYTGESIFTTKRAIISTLRKHLSFNAVNPGFELDTLRRAFKYQRQGFTPCEGTIFDLGMMFQNTTQEQLEETVQMSPGGGRRSIVRFD